LVGRSLSQLVFVPKHTLGQAGGFLALQASARHSTGTPRQQQQQKQQVQHATGCDPSPNTQHPTPPHLTFFILLCRLGELAEPYWVLKDAGYDITVASPAGGAVPIDDASLQGDFKTPECDRMMEDGEYC
jgi:hypothetical protein